MNTLISVIVPVYRVEAYLDRCVESIRQQTYPDFEIILVDDGSPDNCPAMCERLAAEDPRVRVIHKTNGGLSDARNAGIEVARGEYLCFVDSDDAIAPTMLEHLWTAVQKSGAKLAISSIRVQTEDGTRIHSAEESPIRNGCFEAQQLLPKLYRPLGWYYIVAWNKLYHRSLFRTIRFPKGKIHEDEFLVAQIFWTAGKICCIESEEYLYTYQRKGSIMSSRQVQSQCDWLEALYQRFRFSSAIPALADFTAQTRAVYFRELGNLLLAPALRTAVTRAQRKQALMQYGNMEGKTRTEKVNWLLFRICPSMQQAILQQVRKYRQ